MQMTRFNTLVVDYQARQRQILTQKAKQYASNTDRLINFKMGAARRGTNPAEDCIAKMEKHFDAMVLWSKNPLQHTEAEWDEKIVDVQNYCYLLAACLEDMRNELNQPQDDITDFKACPPHPGCVKDILEDD